MRILLSVAGRHIHRNAKPWTAQTKHNSKSAAIAIRSSLTVPLSLLPPPKTSHFLPVPPNVTLSPPSLHHHSVVASSYYTAIVWFLNLTTWYPQPRQHQPIYKIFEASTPMYLKRNKKNAWSLWLRKSFVFGSSWSTDDHLRICTTSF